MFGATQTSSSAWAKLVIRVALGRAPPTPTSSVSWAAAARGSCCWTLATETSPPFPGLRLERVQGMAYLAATLTQVFCIGPDRSPRAPFRSEASQLSSPKAGELEDLCPPVAVNRFVLEASEWTGTSSGSPPLVDRTPLVASQWRLACCSPTASAGAFFLRCHRKKLCWQLKLLEVIV